MCNRDELFPLNVSNPFRVRKHCRFRSQGAALKQRSTLGYPISRFQPEEACRPLKRAVNFKIDRNPALKGWAIFKLSAEADHHARTATG
jgi:hypothetical protein